MFARLPGCVDEVVIVDGHSTDDTIAVAQALLPDVRMVTQTGRGKGDALPCGFAAAHGDIIVMLDADGSTDPAEIPIYLQALLAGADFAKGSRFTEVAPLPTSRPSAHSAIAGSTTSSTRSTAHNTQTSATATTPSGPMFYPSLT